MKDDVKIRYYTVLWYGTIIFLIYLYFKYLSEIFQFMVRYYNISYLYFKYLSEIFQFMVRYYNISYLYFKYLSVKYFNSWYGTIIFLIYLYFKYLSEIFQ